MTVRPRRSAPDVAVVGGGIVGVAAAAALAGGGAQVTLLEARQIGAGASGRNSGVVQHPFDPALRDIHLETVALYRDLAEEGDAGFAFPAGPAGLLLVALAPDGPRRAAAELALSWPELDPLFVSPAELRRLEPGLAPNVSACRVKTGYPLPPAAATAALARLAERLGTDVRTDAVATGLLLDADRAVGVRMADGAVLPAGAVLVAAGPASPALLDAGGRWRPIRALWGVVVEVGLAAPPAHVLEEAEMEEALGDVASGRSGTSATPSTGTSSEPATRPGTAPGNGLDEERDRPGFSLVTAAGRSSLGSTFLEEEPDPARWVSRLVARGRLFIPGIASAPIGAARVCARPIALDGRPLLGPVPGIPGAYIAAGHGPWGISTGPGSARLVADQILGRPVRLPAELDAARFGSPLGA